MTRRLARLAAVALLLGLLTPLAPLVPAAAAPTFGDEPLDDILHWAAEERRCGLTTNKLAALMLAPTYPETGAPSGQAPSPMTLSRWDNQPGLHSFGTVSGQPRAFWHPGVGLWQFDSAGLGAPFTAAQRIDTYVVAAQTAATMAARWCTNPTLAYVWAPWYGCGSTTCRDIYQSIYRSGTDRLVGVARDGEVTPRGGMVRRSCTGPAQSGTFTCWRIDPARAEGFAAFAAPGFGPAPITAPFYVYAAGGREHRHWLKADTGYARGIWATRPLGSNARTSLSWHWGDGIVDTGPGGGGGGGGGRGGAGFRDVPPDAWYLEALTWGLEDDIVQGYDDGTFGPGGAVTRAQAVSWLWALVGRPIAATDASFSDVAPGAWFDAAVSWAAAGGVVAGFPDATFRPAVGVTRAQAVVMLWKVAGRPTAEVPPPFIDVSAEAWFAEALSWADAHGIVKGFPDGTFRGGASVSRAQLTAQVSALAHTEAAWAPGAAIPRTVVFAP